MTFGGKEHPVYAPFCDEGTMYAPLGDDLEDDLVLSESGDRERGAAISAHDRIDRQLRTLARWANDNRRDARRDLVRYWSFKLPAILCSGVSAVIAGLGAGDHIIASLAAVAGICVAVDGVWPGGLLLSAHRRAVHEIHLLIGDARTELDKIEIRTPEMSVVRTEAMIRVLDLIQERRRKIGRYIALAESSLNAVEEGASSGP